MQMTSAIPLPSDWRTSPELPSLPHDEVHVWAVPLEQSSLALTEMLPHLSPDERSRAERFHSLRDRRRHIVAHDALRAVLGQYLQLAPVDVLLRSLPNGKPILASEVSGAQLHFNLSHSHELALIAVSRGRQLGIDVEHIRAELNGSEIARYFFSAAETATLCALPQWLQSRAFFTCWTCKEAYVKARGEGLSVPLNQFEVVVAPGQPAALLRDEADPQAVRHWTLRSLDVGPAYTASLAVEGQGWQLRTWLWQERVRR